ncbi:alanine racemase [Arachidicoccus ginsenosidivorans]|uniref:alanine racemase n=1 Tax=Arachidicoccus ginsenosidivorans TaxID=496057 RepID=UPI0021CF1231|nr:alanine racemase [Arachidicoccus ginsenosidivorans]
MEHTSKIVLNPEALAFNLAFLHREMGPDVVISAVVKGNAYGHGIEAYVPMAEKLGVRHFSVFSTGEAARVKAVTEDEKTEIMIMGDIAPGELRLVIQAGFSFLSLIWTDSGNPLNLQENYRSLPNYILSWKQG